MWYLCVRGIVYYRAHDADDSRCAAGTILR